MPQPTRREIEVKLKVSDSKGVRALLRRIGAVPFGTVFETNTLYDTPQGSFRRTGRLLRLRVEKPVGDRATRSGPRNSQLGQTPRALLTYKAPAGSRTRSRRAHHYKERLESEVEVGNPEGLKPILEVLGLRPGFRYEKFRTSYRFPGLKLLLVDLDETPIGVFLELEGPRVSIDRAARRLGYSAADYLTSTYWELFQNERRRRRKTSRNMVFQRATIQHFSSVFP